MKEVIGFLNANPVGCLATVDQDRPRVRPFQFMLEQDSRLYFCTASTKDVFKQLEANPFVEFSSTSKEFVTVRVRGGVEFSQDLGIKQRIFDSSELVRRIYQTPTNPVFELFFIEHGGVIVSDFSGKPPREIDF